MKNIIVIDNLPLPRQEIDQELREMCMEQTGVKLERCSEKPCILIGQDNAKLLITHESREIIDDELYVSKCALGWTMHGKIEPRIKNNTGHVLNCQKVRALTNVRSSRIDNEMHDIVKSYFDLDSIGITINSNVNSNESRALEIMEKTSRYTGDRWEIGLLWRKDDLTIPNSKPIALRLLKLLEKRLDCDEAYANLYYKEMQRLFECGYAEVVNDFEKEPKRCWYVPHFGVTNVNKPGKVRLVFDAAAKSGSTSLNDLLLTGPDLLKTLLGVLMRFRQYAYAFSTDIRDMFMKINIISEDSDAQRFLWRGHDRKGEPKMCKMNVVLFGAKSSPSTAIFIKNKNARLFSSKYPDSCNKVINNCYMDDYLDSCKTAYEAQKRVKEVEIMIKHAGFPMHSWASNADVVLQDVRNNVAEKHENLFKDPQKPEKVLGLRWLNTSDKLIFNVNFSKIPMELINGNKKPTKREFLALIMSIFDPLGFLIPVTIQARLIMQSIWSSGVKWDEVINQTEFILWTKWLQEIERIKSVQVNRCYQLLNSQLNEAELHVFCDAISKAYGAVAY